MNSSSLWEELAKSIKTFSQQASNVENTKDLDQLKELGFTVTDLQKTIHQLEYSLQSDTTKSLEIVHEEEDIVQEVEEIVQQVIDIKEEATAPTVHEEELVEEQMEMVSEESPERSENTEEVEVPKIEEIQEEDETEEEITEDEAVRELESQIGSLIDNHSAKPSPSFNTSEGASLADKLGKTAIKDLTTAIGISEKFLFMNELFEGDSDSYKTCLEKLNQFNSFSEAKLFLNDTIITKYKWDDENEYVQRFYEVVERRYF